jgi:hypothetical protein
MSFDFKKTLPGISQPIHFGEIRIFVGQCKLAKSIPGKFLDVILPKD